jgi:hypothetical protein
VLLVHGAWVNGSSWNRVTAILQRHGHTVVAVQLPLTSLPEDVAWTRHVLAERLEGPTVLAGHSYGGAVVSGAATGVDNVIGSARGAKRGRLMAADLNNHHRVTLEKIFSHPLSGNVEWPGAVAAGRRRNDHPGAQRQGQGRARR